MNIILYLMIMALLDVPAVPDKPRAARRANRAKAIAHNARVYHNIIGYGIWFEEPDKNGKFRYWASGQEHTTNQQGRWETNYFKTRSYIDTGRVHAGDKHRKGKREYKNEIIDKMRFSNALTDYYNDLYGEA